MKQMKSFALAIPAAACAAALVALGAGAPARAVVPEHSDPNPALVTSGTYKLEGDHGRIVFTLLHHGYSMFSAILPVVNSTLKLDVKNLGNSVVDADIDMTKEVSGIEEFDTKAMPGIFNTAKYPTSHFHSTKITRTGPRTATIVGDLTFMGVTHPATIMAEFHRAGMGPITPDYRVGFNGKVIMHRADWKMPKMGTIGDEVTLNIEAEYLSPTKP